MPKQLFASERLFFSEELKARNLGGCLCDNVLMACTRSQAEVPSIFETNQLESIFQLVQSGFGVTLVPAMASPHGASCALVPLKRAPSRRVGYLRARRHVLSRPMKEFTAWLRRIAEKT